jgi:Holliday junction resolvase/ribosomal protein L37E
MKYYPPIYFRDVANAVCMSGEEYEKAIAVLFRSEGYEVSLTKGTNDRGIDVIAQKDGYTVAVQAKYYSETNKVGSGAVQKAAGLPQRPDIEKAIVITSSSFTKEARKVAANRGVELFTWDLKSTPEKKRPIHSRQKQKKVAANRDVELFTLDLKSRIGKHGRSSSINENFIHDCRLQWHQGKAGIEPIKNDGESDPIASGGNGSNKQTTEDQSTSSGPKTDKFGSIHVQCPGCGKDLYHSGWFSFYSHFIDCEVPESAPPGMGDERWQKVKRKLEERRYDCPNCEDKIDGNQWSVYYDHFVDCRLPDERPPQLPKREWRKVKSKIMAESRSPDPPDPEYEYTCPTCGYGFEKKQPTSKNWFRYANHFDDCELPDTQPAPLSSLEWKRIKSDR